MEDKVEEKNDRNIPAGKWIATIIAMVLGGLITLTVPPYFLDLLMISSNPIICLVPGMIISGTLAVLINSKSEGTIRDMIKGILLPSFITLIIITILSFSLVIVVMTGGA